MPSLALALLWLAAAPRAEVRPAPVLLVLRTATNPIQAKREERLHEEVSLLLDNFAVLSQPVEDRAFASLPLPKQLESVLAVAQQAGAIAALWVAEPVPGQLMVHVLGLSSGRALIRSLEFDKNSAAEQGLALIVRELLGTVFLQARPDSIDPELARVVRTVRQELPRDPLLEPKPPSAPPAARWSVGAALVSSIALSGGQGHWLSLGGRLRGERSISSLLALGLEIELHGARDGLPVSRVSSLEAVGGLSVALRLPGGPFTLLPRLSVLAGAQQLWVKDLSGATQGPVWTLRTRAGLGLRSGTGPVKLMLELSIDAVPLRGGVRLPEQDADLWRAPLWEAQMGAGMCWEG